jgi:SAM-dependent methyltransferase
LDLRKSYFSKRNEFHKENQINRVKVLAKRELDTLDIIKRLSSLQNFFSWNNSAVLDLGAGDQFLRNAVEGRGANYTPVDYGDADFSKDKLPFKNNSFDLIISLAVIEHIENVSNYMEQAFRVLKPNGLFYLSTPNFKYCYKTFYNDPTHVKPYTDLSLSKTLEYCNFENISIYPGIRCKSDWFYTSKNKFTICSKLPFTEKKWYLPELLCGRSTSIFAICNKPS